MKVLDNLDSREYNVIKSVKIAANPIMILAFRKFRHNLRESWLIITH